MTFSSTEINNAVKKATENAFNAKSYEEYRKDMPAELEGSSFEFVRQYIFNETNELVKEGFNLESTVDLILEAFI